jgi:nicotinamidase-related amidase
MYAGAGDCQDGGFPVDFYVRQNQIVAYTRSPNPNPGYATMAGPDWGAFALLLIDVQQDFWSPDAARAFPDFPENTARLLRFCRTEGIDIVHIRALFEPDRSDWMVRYVLKGSIPCIRGTPGAEPLSCARELPGERVVTKHTFDAFHTPDLLPYLRRRGKRFVLAAGLVTSVCVLLTTASAAQRGFLTAVVEDCCADDGPEAHTDTLARYPFIFERTTVDRLNERYGHWMAFVRSLRFDAEGGTL